MDIPLDHMDRLVMQAHEAMRQAYAALRRGEGLEMPNPLELDRYASRKDAWLELGELKGNALSGALADWVHTLTLSRVLFQDTRRIALAWHDPSLELLEPEQEKISLYALRRRWLSEREPARAKLWAGAFSRGAGRVFEAEHIFAERRAHALRLLGAADAQAIEIPCDPPLAVMELADALLARTDEFVEPAAGQRWESIVRAMLGRDVDADFPARISARWLEQLFDAMGLFAGLRLELGPLPSPLGAASFVRALAQLGHAFARAALPPGAPFSLSIRPFDLRLSRRAALFGALPGDALFLKRSLGLGKDRAREQARKIARSLLLSLRLWAARVLLRKVLELDPKNRADAWQEHTARALGDAIPGTLAGVLPRLSAHDACDFLGMLLSAADRRHLIERFDEDWFRNPEAALALRHEQSILTPNPRASEADLKSALSELVASLERALG